MIVLTGASGGVGSAVLRRLVDRGDIVLCLSRTPPPLVRGSGQVIWRELDLATADGPDLANALDETPESEEVVVIHAAATQILDSEPLGPAAEALRINLGAPLALIAAVADRPSTCMVRVVAISSLAAYLPQPERRGYAATKRAWLALAEGTASACLTFQVLVVGAVRTDMLAQYPGTLARLPVVGNWLGRFVALDPNDVASHVITLVENPTQRVRRIPKISAIAAIVLGSFVRWWCPRAS